MRHTLLIVCLLLRAKAQLTFEQPPPGGATKTIAEDAKSGTSLYGLQATDPRGNTPSFGIASSRCESTPPPSSIPTFTINSLDQLVVPEDRLDAESCTKFRFTFIATAGGSTVTSAPLTVNVTDVNDNPPQFIRPLFHGDVWKNDKAGKIVNENNTIIAIDPDISNKSITLTISGAQRTFAITDNGSVYVYGTSRLEVLASPTVLTIQASDGGLTSTANLEIIVHDDPCSSSPCQNNGRCTSLKDHFTCSCLFGYMGIHCANVISETMAQLSFMTPPQGGASVSFPENQAVATALYTIQAGDAAGNTPIYTVLSSTCESTTPSPTQVTPFPINNADQLVVPTGGLDAESCSHYTFSFSVSAGGSTLNSSSLTILVTDINDNPPSFGKSSYNGNVWKNYGQGQIVNDEYIIATDPDVSKLPVTLSISGAQKTFAIYQNGSVYVDDSSGLASLASPTVLTIQASDGGLTSTAPLSIIVHGDPCSSSPCQNGGSCTSTRFNHSCSCLSGYTGKNCQNDQPQSCHCEHGGSCLSLGIGHVCVYAPDPSSATCTFHYDPCKAAPCQNNGTCSQNNGTYSCSCLGSYVGKHCESVDYCDHDNCRNGSTCINLPHSYLCSCRPGYVGEHCTVVDNCHQTHCQHGGTCVNLPNGYMCSYLSTTHEANTTFHLSPVGRK